MCNTSTRPRELGCLSVSCCLRGLVERRHVDGLDVVRELLLHELNEVVGTDQVIVHDNLNDQLEDAERNRLQVVALAPLATRLERATLVLAVLQLLVPELTFELERLDLGGQSHQVGFDGVRLDLEHDARLGDSRSLVGLLGGRSLCLLGGLSLGLGSRDGVLAALVVIIVAENVPNAGVTVVTLGATGGRDRSGTDTHGQTCDGRGLGALAGGVAGDVGQVASEVRVLAGVNGLGRSLSEKDARAASKMYEQRDQDLTNVHMDKTIVHFNQTRSSSTHLEEGIVGSTEGVAEHVGVASEVVVQLFKAGGRRRGRENERHCAGGERWFGGPKKSD